MSSWSNAGQLNSIKPANNNTDITYFCRDPIAGSRPRFREIAIVLTGNPRDVLSIPQEALDAHKLAGVLGSPLEVGKNIYSDLQNKYCLENVYEWTESLFCLHQL